MPILPRCAHLRGRNSDLYCAVQAATLAGSPEVDSWGGGETMEEACTSEHDNSSKASSLLPSATPLASMEQAPAAV